MQSKLIFRKFLPLVWAVHLVAALNARAASVGPAGYTNDFSVPPVAADFSTTVLAGGTVDITTVAGLDAAVAALTATGINTPLPSTNGIPPTAGPTAVYNSTGKNLQTRPNGAKMNVILATFTNNAEDNATSVSLNYMLLQSVVVSEQVNGVRVYYSLTGAANSWSNVPAWSATAAGLVSAEVTLAATWNVGSPLYLLFADDNGSPIPDTANQIANFFIVASGFPPQFPVAITNQPQDITVNENQPAAFTVGTDGHAPVTFQWYRGASPITDATNASYTVAVAGVPDNGAQFSVVAANVASNLSYSVTSSVATLTVLADTNPPVLLDAQLINLTKVQLNFSRTITAATATNLGNYAVTNSVGVSFTVTNAALSGSLSNVILDFTPAVTAGLTNTVTVNGIVDRSYSANVIAPNSQAGFYIAAPVPLTISVSGNGNNGVKVIYSTNVQAFSATNLANYALTNLSGSVLILSASLEVDSRTILLTTSGQLPFAPHWLTVNGVYDGATGFFAIAPDSQGVFTNDSFTTGLVRRELYLNIGGGIAISILTNSTSFIAHTPSTVDFLPSMGWPSEGIADNYGGRMFGLLVPPVTGTYTFAVRSDDNGRLFFSTNESAANKTLISEETGCCGTFDSHASAAFNLVAGRRYFIEALMKEGGGGDFLYVAWKTPTNSTWTVIPGEFLGDDTAAAGSTLTVLQQPTNTSAMAGQTATFTVVAAGSSSIGTNITYQWQRNGLDIPGANTASYTTPVLFETNSGAVYRAILSVSGLGQYSSNAVLTVTPDIVPPALVQVLNIGLTNVQLTFSEALETARATNTANYIFTNGLAVTKAVLAINNLTVLLTTEPLVLGSNYTILISNLRDRATLPNTMATDTPASFVAAAFAPFDIGGAAPAGAVAVVADGFNVSGGGADIGGTADQFFFGYQLRVGDFDVQVRLPFLAQTDALAKAGLMARESLAANSRYAAVLATPSISGSFFQSRSTVGGGTTTTGTTPVNYPYTWLRLKRAGNVFTGYLSYDGLAWAQLGTVTLALTDPVYFGMAVGSHVAGQTSTAQFRDVMDTSSTLVGTLTLPGEPPGPSSRRTGLAITEIMYHPPARGDGRNLEFVEVFNSQPFFEDISGWKISGDVDYTFPPGTVLASGATLVVAKVPADLQAVYGIGNVVGPYTGSLPNDAGTVRLRNKIDAVLLEINYDSRPPWPVSPDGTGHSLVLSRATYGENSPLAWSASDRKGGSPGGTDGTGPEPARPVVINEHLAHTDFPEVDYVELFNRSTQPLNLSGFWLSDDAATNKFRIPDGTVIPARGFLSYTETTLGFSLNSGGESIFLVNSNQTRVIDAVAFEGQVNGVASGRFPDGAPGFRELLAKTPGTNNAGPLLRAIVINEIMYDPISGNDDDQYVEIYNGGTNAVNLTGWKFTAGISYTFPTNTVIPANGYVVVGRNVTNLLAHYPGALNVGNTFGGFSGALSHRGERLALSMPDQLTNVAGITYSVVSEVTYHTGGRWGQWSHGGGSSLELIDPHSDIRLAPNWADSDETAKAAWTTVEFTGVLDLGSGSYAPDQLQMFLQDPGECLVDDVEVFRAGGANRITNPSFDTSTTGWFFQGTQIRSGREAAGGIGDSGCLHIRASGRGDTGANRIRTVLSSTLAGGDTATLRAKVRWLKGNPEILLRLHGNWLEAAGVMTLPTNLGTPGAINSRVVTNAGPAIVEVSHSPVLPAAGQPVVVTARVSDPDGVTAVVLNYRNDTGGGATTPVNMLDDGTGGDATAGDGIYSATIPGQSAGVIIAFYVQAVDNFSPAAATLFPNNAPGRECLVGFGEANPASTLGTYRTWVTQSNLTYWTNREKNSNEPLDATFAYGNFRVVYNMLHYYSGSPFHTGGFNSPVGNECDYVLSFSDDDRMLGANDFVISTVGNQGNDNTAQREQAAFWMLQELGVPTLHRRHINMYVNGNHRGVVMEDSQQPGSDILDEFFPDDAGGHLHKVEDWFEFDDAGTGFNNVDATLQKFTTTGGVKKVARYRWNFRPRAVKGSANDFNDLFNLVEALNATGPEPYTSQTLALVDVEEWMRAFAVERIAGNWDSYSYDRGKNMYAYKPVNGRWNMLAWDIDFVFGSGGDGPQTTLFGGESTISRLTAHPPFARAYWRAFEDAVNGPMLDSKIGPLLDAKYAALTANGLNVATPAATKDYIAQRRAYILSQLATVAANFALATNSVTTNNNLVTLGGTAPITIQTIQFNGVAWPVTWTGVNTWTVKLPVNPGTNLIAVAGIDVRGNFVAGATNNVTVVFTGVVPSPSNNVVLNEIMFQPVVAGGEYVELFNTSSNTTFDLSGWQINGLGYTFPPGSFIAPRAYLVLAKDRDIFATAYGLNIPVFDEFSGNLQTDGETLTLLQPGSTNVQDVVIDKVRYESAAPWSTNASGTGSSMQLLDPLQDNSRAGNWSSAYIPGSIIPGTNIPSIFYPAFTNDGYQFASFSGTVGNIFRLQIHLGQVGDVYIDDLFLANGTNAEAGPNLIVNGDFETPLPGAPAATNLLAVGLYHAPTVIATTNAHSGSNSLHIICTNNANANLANIIAKTLSVTNGQVCTLSFWYLPTSSASNLFARFPNGTIGSLSTPVALNPVINPASNSIAINIPSVTNFPVAFRTPGAANTVATSLPAFPPLWLNEVQTQNVTGPTNSAGQHTAWLELYNTGTNVLALTNLFLSGTYSNYTNWAFPPGATIAPGEFKIIFADGLTNLSTLSELHTSFVLPPGAGSLALSRLFNGQPQVIDYLNYAAGLNRSYGSFPDGQSFDRQEFYYVTPGGTNNATAPPLMVFINEWMADNTTSLADPADNDFEDWFEIYNPGTNTVSLSGYYLTDNLANKFQYLIPAGYTIAPGGHLLVWADSETGQNSSNRIDLHVNFRLSASGEAIGLFAADGTQIDAVTFGAQTANKSEGRYQDGAVNIYPMITASPRATNLSPFPNTPPVLAVLTNQFVHAGQTLQFTVHATDSDLPAQTLSFSLDVAPVGAAIGPASGVFSWTPAPSAATSTNAVTVRVTDNGTPGLSATRSFQITVIAMPVVTGVNRFGSDLVLTLRTFPGRSYRVEYKDDLNAALWTPQGGNFVAPGASLSITNDISAAQQRFFRVVTGE